MRQPQGYTISSHRVHLTYGKFHLKLTFWISGQGSLWSTDARQDNGFTISDRSWVSRHAILEGEQFGHTYVQGHGEPPDVPQRRITPTSPTQ